MAILVSPGVDVQIIDESFYGGAGAGTIPLIVMATAANKPSPGGSGVSPYTLPSEAGKLFLATSQRELIQNFGNPTFYSLQGTQLHGHELNEYGLHAAYQYLGISNRAYVMRADIDLAQLEASDTAPRGEPVAGTYWLDLGASEFGLFQSNGNSLPGAAWINQTVRIVGESDADLIGGVYVPKASFGSNGNYAIVTVTSDNKFFEKIANTWYEIGSTAWKGARPTKVRGSASPSAVADGSVIIINGVTFTLAAAATVDEAIADLEAQRVANGTLTTIAFAKESGALVISNTAGGNVVIAGPTTASGIPSALTPLGITAGTHKGVEVYRTNDAQYPSGSVSGDVWVKGTTPNKGANWLVKYYNANIGQWVIATAPFFPFDATKADGDATKDLAAFAAMGVPTVGNVYVGYEATYDAARKVWVQRSGIQQLRRWNGKMWEPLVYEASAAEPSTEPMAGTYWYNADLRIDIMVGDGNTWNGYRKRYPMTDPMGVIIAGSAPVSQSDGSELVENDLWCDSSDLENYPALYRYNSLTKRWKRIDNTDQTTPFGVIFGDARANSGPEFFSRDEDGNITPVPTTYPTNSELPGGMLESDFLDPDAPDPRFYPDGMLLFNTRYSTYNVKQWLPDYFKDGNFDPNTHYGQESYTVGDPYYLFPPLASTGRWVTASGNRHDGAPYMGRKAQRIMVVRAMSAAVQQNEDLRSELIYYNLMAAPGYPELIDELVLLNTDQKEVSFIVGDTPARLKPMGSEIEAWATNRKLSPSNGDEGLTTGNTYVGLYYPWGLSTNIDGSEIMIPPSTIALRTMAYNDQVAYQWFAPAGFQRGMVTNATTVGYLTDENEFKPVILNPGQRDVLYLNKINPIAYIPGRGLVVYGQKTLHPLESALDRVNVARLANYLKYNLDTLVKPFLFEQNDQQTRDSAKLTVERFLSGLITLRALEDFAVLCDETNNTPERRDRNELWIDIAIKPIKAIEFIYIPVRIRNSGDSMALGNG